MDLEKNIKHWLAGSENDFAVAQDLFKLKHYPQCLFFCHLSVEKLLKAIVMKKTKNYPPYIHDLRRLAEIAGLSLNAEQEKILDKIFTFNIGGRYREEKFEFYKEYNSRNAAIKYLKITDDLLLWLKKEFLKK